MAFLAFFKKAKSKKGFTIVHKMLKGFEFGHIDSNLVKLKVKNENNFEYKFFLMISVFFSLFRKIILIYHQKLVR